MVPINTMFTDGEFFSQDVVARNPARLDPAHDVVLASVEHLLVT